MLAMTHLIGFGAGGGQQISATFEDGASFFAPTPPDASDPIPLDETEFYYTLPPRSPGNAQTRDVFFVIAWIYDPSDGTPAISGFYPQSNGAGGVGGTIWTPFQGGSELTADLVYTAESTMNINGTYRMGAAVYKAQANWGPSGGTTLSVGAEVFFTDGLVYRYHVAVYSVFDYTRLIFSDTDYDETGGSDDDARVTLPFNNDGFSGMGLALAAVNDNAAFTAIGFTADIDSASSTYSYRVQVGKVDYSQIDEVVGVDTVVANRHLAMGLILG